MISFLLINFRKQGAFIVLLVITLIATSDSISSRLVKKTIKRERPCHLLSPNDGLRPLVHCGGGYSFTSSHATNHFAIALFFIMIWNRKWIVFGLLSWAFLISIAQVYVGVHYPLDILFGSLLGMSIGYWFGKFGQYVGRLLLANKIPVTLIDFNSDRVDALRQLGLKVYYGDPTRHDLLASAGAGKAGIVSALQSDRAQLESRS